MYYIWTHCVDFYVKENIGAFFCAMYVYHVRADGSEEGINPTEPELQAAVSCHVGVENRIRVQEQ